MKHIQPATKEARLALATHGEVCGFLIFRVNTKCVDADSPFAPFLKGVPED